MVILDRTGVKSLILLKSNIHENIYCTQWSKVLRSSMLVQGVLLARLTADTVGQRAQLSPWVSLQLKCQCGTRAEARRNSRKKTKKTKRVKYADSCKVDASIIVGLGRTKCCTLVTICRRRPAVAATRLRSSGSYLVRDALRIITCCGVRFNRAGVLIKIDSLWCMAGKGQTYWEQWERHYCTIPSCHCRTSPGNERDTPSCELRSRFFGGERHHPSSAAQTRLAHWTKVQEKGLWLSENLSVKKQQHLPSDTVLTAPLLEAS